MLSLNILPPTITSNTEFGIVGGAELRSPGEQHKRDVTGMDVLTKWQRNSRYLLGLPHNYFPIDMIGHLPKCAKSQRHDMDTP